MYKKQMKESWNSWHSGIEYTPKMNQSLERGFKAGLSAVQDSVVEWHRSVFPRSTDAAIVAKLEEEIEELRHELLCPGNHDLIAMECADVIIVACSLLDRMGKKMHEVVHAKMEVNKSRDWLEELPNGDRKRDKSTGAGIGMKVNKPGNCGGSLPVTPYRKT